MENTNSMIRNLYARLVFVAAVAALAIWVDSVREIQIRNPFNDAVLFEQSVAPRLGLDLQGGLQVLLEADLPETTEVDAAKWKLHARLSKIVPTLWCQRKRYSDRRRPSGEFRCR
jgi:preprotein translocase subunit SecD